MPAAWSNGPMSGYDGASDVALLHRLLLRVAGRFPDETLTDSRVELGSTSPGEAAEVVARHALDRGIRLDAEDVRLLTGLVSDAALRERLGELGSRGIAEAPERFVPALPERLPPGYELPPVLDLSLRTAEEAAGFVDEIDVTAVALVPDLPAVGLWRSWRLRPAALPVRVFVIEFDCPVDDLAGLTAGITLALRQAGAATPQVEAYAVGTEVPPYQRAARDSSALLWAAEATEPIRVAQAFDRLDPERGPSFDDGHERLTGPERDAVLRYFDEAPALLTTTDTMVDFVEPERGSVVPVIHRTDGRWAWTDLAPYYLRTYGLAPDPGLLEHVRANGYQVPELGHVARQRVLAELYHG